MSRCWRATLHPAQLALGWGTTLSAALSVLQMANETSATPMTIGRLNALLDALARLDARQPAEASSQVASSATDKERARKNEETKKRRDGALRNILLNVVASETPLVVDVLLKTDPALGVLSRLKSAQPHAAEEAFRGRFGSTALC